MARILVTGGLGFQGSHLTERLINDGHDVIVMNTPSSDAMRNLSLMQSSVSSKKPVVIWGSATDELTLERLDHNPVDVVFHLASKINVDESIERPRVFFDTNILGTYSMLELARRHKAQLILASTCEVYGGGENLNEESILNPKSPYASSKASADRIAFSYYKTYGQPIKIVRPFNVFGPRQKSGKGGALIPILFSRAMEGKDLQIHGSGEQSRDFVFVSDVVEAYVRIMESDALVGQAINIGTGVATSVKQIAEQVCAVSGTGNVVHVPGRLGQVSTFTCDGSKCSRVLSWKPSVKFSDGMASYWKWLNSGM
jgi:dTDP-glucose 4,6-dehydratase